MNRKIILERDSSASAVFLVPLQEFCYALFFLNR